MRIEVDRNPPTVETFLNARHYSDDDSEISLQKQIERIERLEAEHGVLLPEILRRLYQQQNGGHTQFQIVPAVDEPGYVFEATDPYPAFQQSWRDAFIDNDLLPLENIKTLGWYSDQTEFGDESVSWRTAIEDIDRLLVLNCYGSEAFLCLDFRDNQQKPGVVHLSQGMGAERFDTGFRYEDFETFFKSTRRILD
ncbi:SMI1/KNR4 family protein [Xanthobacteraceae bacterium A53D]